MRMSAQRGTAVAFELPSDASVIVLSTTLWKGLTCLWVNLVFNAFFLQVIVFIKAQCYGVYLRMTGKTQYSHDQVDIILLMHTHTVVRLRVRVLFFKINLNTLRQNGEMSEKASQGPFRPNQPLLLKCEKKKKKYSYSIWRGQSV